MGLEPMGENEAKIKFRELMTIIEARQVFEQQTHSNARPKQLTTIDFTDADELSLLHYAILANDVDAISDLIKKGASLDTPIGKRGYLARTPIETALNLGHIHIAELLEKHDVDIKLAKLQNINQQEGRQFYLSKVTHYLKERLDTTAALSNTDLDLAIATGDFSLFTQVKKRVGEGADTNTDISDITDTYSLLASLLNNKPSLNKPSLLRSAIYSGNLSIVKALMSEGETVDLNENSYKDNFLMLAASLKQWDMVDYFASQGANVKHVGRYKNNLLWTLVEQGDLVRFKHYLDIEKIDPTQLDVQQNNLLHITLSENQMEMYALLKSRPEMEALLEQKNIFGETPLMMAQRLNRETGSSQTITSVPSRVNISMLPLMASIKHYLMTNNRDMSYFAAKGYCNGLSLLFGLYSANGLREYFFKTLELINSWDRSKEMLEKPFKGQPGMERWADKYENLGALMEKWINDLNWFVAKDIGDNELFNQLDITQKSRELQYAVVQAKDVFVDNLQFSALNTEKMSRNQLNELFAILQKMPDGLYIDIKSKAHAVGVNLNEKNQFQYYDSNSSYITPAVDTAEAICNEIIDTNYITLMSSLGNSKYDENAIDLDIKWANLKRQDHHAQPFNYYRTSEYPKNAAEAEEKSTAFNQLTPLHIAVLTRSMQNIADLVNNKFIDADKKDAHGKTALDYAIDNSDVEVTELLIRSGKCSLSDDRLKDMAFCHNICLLAILKNRDEACYQNIIRFVRKPDFLTKLINDPAIAQYSIPTEPFERILTAQDFTLKDLNIRGRVSSESVNSVLTTFLLRNNEVAIKRLLSLNISPGAPLDPDLINYLRGANKLSPEMEITLQKSGFISTSNVSQSSEDTSNVVDKPNPTNNKPS